MQTEPNPYEYTMVETDKVRSKPKAVFDRSYVGMIVMLSLLMSVVTPIGTTIIAYVLGANHNQASAVGILTWMFCLGVLPFAAAYLPPEL